MKKYENKKHDKVFLLYNIKKPFLTFYNFIVNFQGLLYFYLQIITFFQTKVFFK